MGEDITNIWGDKVIFLLYWKGLVKNPTTDVDILIELLLFESLVTVVKNVFAVEQRQINLKCNPKHLCFNKKTMKS